MTRTWIFGIDKDIIQLHYDKDVKLLFQDLMDITMEAHQYIEYSERHYLVLKVPYQVRKAVFHLLPSLIRIQ